MKYEERIYKASMIAGLLDIIVGLIFCLTGLHEWYFKHFKFFGVLGIGMLLYGITHYILYKGDIK